jgi:hypothetical protein
MTTLSPDARRSLQADKHPFLGGLGIGFFAGTLLVVAAMYFTPTIPGSSASTPDQTVAAGVR